MRNIVGDIYESYRCGKFIIKDKVTSQQYIIKFLDTGYVRGARLDHIKTGKVNDPYARLRYGIGYMGVGKYGEKSSPRKYSAWCNMMKRCYLEDSGATVCNRWHNLQWFCEDLNTLPGYLNWCKDRSYQLDKDVLSKGVKIYSPDTCIFIPHKDNLNESREKFLYEIKDSKGVVHTTTRLIDFCKTHSLDARRLGEVMSGKRHKHNGFTKVSKIELRA